jgi:outer membrane protein assembly factor BamB
VKQTVGIVLLMALMGAPVAAQRPMTPSDYQPPPSTTPAQPGQSQPRTAGDEARARYKATKEKEKNPYFGKPLAPLGMLPMTVAWGQWLSGPPTSPGATDGTLYFIPTVAHQVQAWDIKSGALAWAIPDVATKQPMAVDAGRLTVVLAEELAAFDAKTGKPIWRLPIGGQIAAPVVAKGGWLILSLETGDGGELRALRGETGEVVWQKKFPAPVRTLPVIVGDRLYAAPQNKHLLALDLVSGQQLWDQEFDAFVSAIAASDQRVFVGTTRMFFGLDHAGETRWKWRIGMEVIGQPVTDGTAVYAAFADNTLRAFDAGRGAMQWRTALTYRPPSGPLWVADTIVLTQIAPVLHAYETKEGKPAGDYVIPVSDRTFIVGQPVVAPGATFFQDTMMLPVAQGFLIAFRRAGLAMTPLTDVPGAVCRPLSLPGEEAPPTASAPSTPPKA